MPSLSGILTTARTKFLSREARIKWLLRRSMDLYGGIYDQYWSTIRPDRDLAQNKEWFDRMTEDGVCVVPDFIDSDTVAALRREIEAIPSFIAGNYEGPIRHRHLASDGVSAIEITEATPHAERLTKGNAAVANLARALYGDAIHLSAASILNKYNPDRIDSSNVPHWDDWRVRFKAFLYVTDVGEENAPMIYMKRSHKAAIPWRREKDFASMYLPMASAGGSWWPVEQLGFEQLSCTGRAGTLLLFNALGLHSGTQLRGAARVMLMSMYTTHIPYGFRPY